MKFWNLNVKRGADGGKHLDIQLHGVIDGGWMDDDGVDTGALISEMQQHLDAKTVGVRINSVGGSAFGGVALYNALSSHPGLVTCSVEGLAASAASLVAMAGTTKMGRGAMMMIHSPSTVAMGNAEELRKTADVLDKVQDALASIYTKKTGKTLDEVNDLLDDETWMTADEAFAAGFADEIANDAADGDPEPDEDDKPQMTADSVIWNGVSFPIAAMSQQILAMAARPTPPARPLPSVAEIPVDAVAPAAPVLSVVPALEPQPPISRAELALRSPELVQALLEEGRAAGTAAERERLKSIDDLEVNGCDDLVIAAKYGEKPSDAPTLAMAVVKAGKMAGAELLAARRVESRALAGVTTTAPGQTSATAEARVIQAMTDGGNSIRGGMRK